LITNYPKATLYISEINLLESFRTLIRFQHPNLKFSGWSKGQKLFQYLSKNPEHKIEGLSEGDQINFTPDIKLNVLYPSKDCIEHFDTYFKKELDRITKRVGEIESRIDPNSSNYLSIDFSKNFNDQSVALEALNKDFNTMYLADLELESHGGIKYVLENAFSSGREYDVFKVPHHGSKTSFNKDLWTDVLKKPTTDQILKLTCWKIGKHYLPEKEIVDEMLKISENIFCTGVPDKETIKINNKTKKYYNNSNLKFSVAAHNYGSISVHFDYEKNELSLNTKIPAVHVTELFN